MIEGDTSTHTDFLGTTKTRREALKIFGALTGGALAVAYLPKVFLPVVSNLPAAEARASQENPEFVRVQEAIDSGVEFILSRYNEEDKLLRASPIAEPDVSYLKTDNYLALLALKKLGVQDPRIGEIEKTLQGYSPPRHGVIEALDGQPIEWPPHVSKVTGYTDHIKTESRPPEGNVMDDWEQYADLAFYGALNEINKGNPQEAQKRYDQAMTMMTDFGFADVVHKADPEGRFTNYKLPLAIITSQRLGHAQDPRMLDLLLKMQNEAGGFVSLSNPTEGPIGDPNVETTSISLLALSQLRDQMVTTR